MKFMPSNQTHTKFGTKSKSALANHMVSRSENDPVDVKGLANDPELKRTLEASREDRRSGRMYSGKTALEMLQKINREKQEGANL